MNSYTISYEDMVKQPGNSMKKRGIPGSTLKWIAIISMLVDHIAAAILGRSLVLRDINVLMGEDINAMIMWFQDNGMLFGIYYFMRMLVGRIAFPIFCFLLIEGFQKTGNVKKYILRLGIFALISEIPFDLAFSGKIMEFGYQNVFFTLVVGLLVLVSIEAIQKQNIKKSYQNLLCVIAVVIGAGIAELLKTDYGAVGVIFIVVLYCFRNIKVWQIVLGTMVLVVGLGLGELMAGIAFIFIHFYNGERGMKLKYVFYLFYPFHLLILYLISVFMGMGGIIPV